MNGPIILIATAVIVLEAAAIVCLYFYSRRIERRCNRCLVKTVREQDRMIQQLERILLEKETFEKLLKMLKSL